MKSKSPIFSHTDMVSSQGSGGPQVLQFVFGHTQSRDRDSSGQMWWKSATTELVVTNQTGQQRQRTIKKLRTVVSKNVKLRTVVSKNVKLRTVVSKQI